MPRAPDALGRKEPPEQELRAPRPLFRSTTQYGEDVSVFSGHGKSVGGKSTVSTASSRAFLPRTKPVATWLRAPQRCHRSE